MSNAKGFKRALAIIIAATCMLTFSFSMAFAASSPTKGEVKASGGKYKTTASGTATYAAPAKKSAKNATVAATVTKDGVKYKVTAIGSKAFKGSKAKTITIKSKNVTKIAKNAFSGSKVKKSKIIVKVPKKCYKKYVKMLTKAGIKKSNVKKF